MDMVKIIADIGLETVSGSQTDVDITYRPLTDISALLNSL